MNYMKLPAQIECLIEKYLNEKQHLDCVLMADMVC